MYFSIIKNNTPKSASTKMSNHLTVCYSIIGLILLLGTFSCRKNRRLVFEMSDFKNIDRVDTLEAFPSQGIYILGLYRHTGLGDFTYDLGVLKNLKDDKQVFYKSKINPNILRISKEYLAFVDYHHGFHNIGWYYVKNKLIKDSLPGFSRIRDSISKTVPKAFVALTKSYITVYSNSNEKKTFDYEEFVLDNKGVSLHNLDYGLYILEKRTLKKVSENGEDIYKKRDGVFYIPAPGLGITHKWKKSKLLQTLDSITSQQIPLKTFFIDQDN